MLMDTGHKHSESAVASRSPDDAALWKDSANNAATLFFPANFLEPTTPETFLELDPADFFTNSVPKGSCVGQRISSLQTTPVNCWARLEPSREPCTDEIPWSDLVFWLGNTSTGEVSCSCAQCTHRAMRACNAGLMRQHRYSPYQQQQQQRRVSSRVPVINLPRIEGVN